MHEVRINEIEEGPILQQVDESAIQFTKEDNRRSGWIAKLHSLKIILAFWMKRHQRGRQETFFLGSGDRTNSHWRIDL